MTLIRTLFAALIVAAACMPLTATAAERSVTVIGEGNVVVAPDMATIRIGVSSSGKTAREAGDANAKQMSAVLAAIKEAGVAERDLQTSRISLQPLYDSQVRPPRLTGFQASNQVTVKVRQIDKMSGVLDRAIGAGANEMSGINFIVSDESKLLDQARGEAIADAHRKAELYARAAGAKVGKVVAIAEEGSAPPSFPMPALRAGAPAPVARGEQTLRVVVTVSYELTP